MTTQGGPRPALTTEAGAPLADNQNAAAAGPGGPLLIQDQQLLEKLAHFNRERVPERIVHARGAGAYGTFTPTRDVNRWTRAKFLSGIGKQTEVFARFSTVAGSLGSADAVREPRGFALKFCSFRTGRGRWRRGGCHGRVSTIENGPWVRGSSWTRQSGTHWSNR